MKYSVAIVAALTAAVSAQSIPNCISSDFSSLVAASGCGFDFGCLCKDNTFITSLEAAAAKKCSQADQNAAFQSAYGICLAQGITLTSPAAAPATSATAPATSASSPSKNTATATATSTTAAAVSSTAAATVATSATAAVSSSTAATKPTNGTTGSPSGPTIAPFTGAASSSSAQMVVAAAFAGVVAFFAL